MKFISLINPKNQNVITVDADGLILRLEIDGTSRERRIKPYIASILYELFSKHPNPLSYDRIVEILKGQGLVISDFTRMHRKLSEIRRFIQQLHPSLEDLILNTRNFGYSLPLQLKNLHQIGSHEKDAKFASTKITKAIQKLEALINDSIDFTSQSKVIKHTQGYVINRDPVKQILVEKIATFNEWALSTT